MNRHVIEFDQKCKSCKGTGVYIGMGEVGGAGVVCHTCHGSGCHHVKIEYEDFEERLIIPEFERVHECNPGIKINADPQFGGMSYQDWLDDKPFPPKSENRQYTCPAWWYQTANYDLMPEWKECGYGAFYICEHFADKDKCWERWDRENS